MLILLAVRSLRLNIFFFKKRQVEFLITLENSPLSQAGVWLNGSTLGKDSRAPRLIQQLVSTKVGIQAFICILFVFLVFESVFAHVF